MVKEKKPRKRVIRGGYNKKKPLRVFTAFSGYDSQCMALNTLKEDTNFDYDLVGWSEIDKYAIVAHNALFPQWKDRNFGDISKINWDEVPDFDLFTYSSPCFVEGTRILVKYKEHDEYPEWEKIEDVQVGWYAMTHKGQYKRITEVMKNPYNGLLYTITNSGYDEVTCTADHPFYCRPRTSTHNTPYEWKMAKQINILEDECMCFDRDKWDGQYYDSHYGFEKIEITSTKGDEIYVYNLEVEEDHSYVAESFVVHNCTDFSQAGYQKGGEEGSGTRSSLLWECRKAILNKKPKYLLFENVKALVSDKFIHLFMKWVKELESYGYNNFWQVLNAKDYGIPQSRERIFMISIRKDENDPNPYYEFPEPIELTKFVDDVLEDDVDEKYYLEENRKDGYVKHLQKDYPHQDGLDTEYNEELW